MNLKEQEYRAIDKKMQVGENFIVDTKTLQPDSSLSQDTVTWYLFKVPINDYERKVGAIEICSYDFSKREYISYKRNSKCQVEYG